MSGYWKMVAVAGVAQVMALGIVVALAQPAATVTSQPTAAPAGEKRVTPSGLTIVEQQKGEAGAQPGDMLFVNYRGRLENGKEFDSSYNRGQPFKLGKLGSGQVIKGWDEGLVGMTVGEKRQLIVPPALGYGDKPQGSNIPANSTLIFDVELVGLVRLKADSK
jgi:FKBP-type peptidyl-prolyl cis-trans isomerase